MVDLNDKFLSMALLAHFEDSREALASRHSSHVEDDEEEEDDDEPRELPEEDGGAEPDAWGTHRINTETLRCSCLAPACFTCGWCSAQCICPEKT